MDLKKFQVLYCTIRVCLRCFKVKVRVEFGNRFKVPPSKYWKKQHVLSHEDSFSYIHEQMKLKSMFSSLPDVICSYINHTFPTSFTRFLQICTDKPVNIMTSIRFVAYSI